MIFSIIGKVSDRLEHQTQRSHAIPPYLNVLIALRYFSKGGFYSEIADIHGVSKSSVCRAIHATTDALCATMGDFVFPTMPSTQKSTKESFFDIAGFPKVLGAIDCTLVPIMAPKRDEVAYVCRKGYHALNIQAVCDANMRFTNCVFKWPGSVHDSYIWNNSALGQYFEKKNIDGWLLGDSGYACRPWLLTPVLNPSSEGQEKYNRCHIKTRNTIERAFGLCKSRFRCLHKTTGVLQFTPERSLCVVRACFLLHNMCIHERIPLPQGIELLRGEGTATELPCAADFQTTSSGCDGLSARHQLILHKFT
ncbi:putative nuclease HARBI1 [Haliotis rufescens]|uniref:putative nuclease HARBI1 n=1 Tax=Haliotis rufescens TaxID=6454 RepID=UPI00201F61B8|nr:putative nuclease HARBI1 [Haliotis rufescens]